MASCARHSEQREESQRRRRSTIVEILPPADRDSGTLEEYLDGLLSRAHNRIYYGRKAGLGLVYRFFTTQGSKKLSDG